MVPVLYHEDMIRSSKPLAPSSTVCRSEFARSSYPQCFPDLVPAQIEVFPIEQIERIKPYSLLNTPGPRLSQLARPSKLNIGIALSSVRFGSVTWEGTVLLLELLQSKELSTVSVRGLYNIVYMAMCIQGWPWICSS
jgi:hypothetical protein